MAPLVAKTLTYAVSKIDGDRSQEYIQDGGDFWR